jgi:tRNA pseudouridine55 synthase
MNSGFLLINKLSGPTSHDIVDELRKITGIKKIGHSGTLDPFASGLLIVAVGREATRQIAQFIKQDKTYVAKLHLGAVSDTYDRTGRVRNVARPRDILSGLFRTKIEKILQKFVGPQKQIPPMYSAKKINGKKLYELARQGKEIERNPIDINIHYIKQLAAMGLPPAAHTECSGAHIIIEVRVSSGTYIRSLANDIGQALGCGAYLEELKRTRIGNHELGGAVDIAALNKKNWRQALMACPDERPQETIFSLK